MALIKCKECGHMISDKAKSCPNCGYKTVVTNKCIKQLSNQLQKGVYITNSFFKNKSKGLIIVIAWILIVLVGGICFFLKNASDSPVKITEEFANKIKNYDKLGTFHEGLALVQRNGLWGYINTKGDEVIPCSYYNAQFRYYGFNFSEGLAVVADKNGKCGYINKKGEMVIKPQFDHATNFSEGIASVLSGHELNFIRKDGKFIKHLSNKYTWDFNLSRNLPSFENGICEVHIPKETPIEGEWVDIIYVDKNGNQVERPEEKMTESPYEIYWENDKVGYKDSFGNILIPAKYTTIGDFSYGVAVVTLEYGERSHGSIEWYSDDYIGIYGYVDMKGNDTFTSQDYDRIEHAKLKELNR